MTQPLESDKQISLWPVALLGTLLFALLPSKRNPSGEPVHPQDSTEVKRNLAPRQSVIITNIPPAPPQSHIPKWGKDETPPWKKGAEIAAVAIALGLLIVNIFQMRSTQKSADSADRTMKVAYRPRLLLIGIDPRVKSSPAGIEPALDQQRLTVQIILPNTGPFSARNVRFFRYSNVSARDQIKKGIYEELFGELKAIPPKVENYNPGMVIVGTKTVTDSEIRELKSGTLWATFSILVQYDDDFGITHHTEYCDLFTLQPYNDICPWPVRND
jgi:hypothetical protein